MTVAEAADGAQTGGQTDREDTTRDEINAGSTNGNEGTFDGAIDGKAISGDGSATDPENGAGFLVRTGVKGAAPLVLGGLLSVAAGVIAWQLSHPRSSFLG